MRDQQADVEEEPGEVGIETINTRILSKLNEFDAHTRRKETCLGCGYVGVMGIEVDRPGFRRHLVAIIHGNKRGVYEQQQAVHG